MTFLSVEFDCPLALNVAGVSAARKALPDREEKRRHGPTTTAVAGMG
jgi:hypothetical protein